MVMSRQIRIEAKVLRHIFKALFVQYVKPHFKFRFRKREGPEPPDLTEDKEDEDTTRTG